MPELPPNERPTLRSDQPENYDPNPRGRAINALGSPLKEVPKEVPETDGLPPSYGSEEEVAKARASAFEKVMGPLPNAEGDQPTKNDVHINKVVSDIYDEHYKAMKDRPYDASQDTHPMAIDTTDKIKFVTALSKLSGREILDNYPEPIVKEYLRWMRDNEDLGRKILKENHPDGPSWYEQLGHGAWDMAMTLSAGDIAKGIVLVGSKGKASPRLATSLEVLDKYTLGMSIGQAKGAIKHIGSLSEIQAREEKDKKENLRNFAKLVANNKKHPELLREDVLQELYDWYATKGVNLSLQSLKINDPEKYSLIKSLNIGERFELSLMINHEDPSVKSNLVGSKRPRLRSRNISLDGSEEYKRNLSFAGSIDQEKKGQGQFLDLIKDIDVGESGNVKIDDFYIKNLGKKGIFENMPNSTGAEALKHTAGLFYSLTPIARREAQLQGGVSLWGAFTGKSDSPLPPIRESWAGILFQQSAKSDQELYNNFAAGVKTQEDLNAKAEGRDSLILSRVMAGITGMSKDEVDEKLSYYGANNQDLASSGALRFSLAGMAGRAGTLTRAGVMAGEGIAGGTYATAKYLASKGILTLSQASAVRSGVMASVGAVHAVEAYTFGLPVKLVGYTVGTGGRIILAGYGLAAQKVAGLAAKSASAIVGQELSPKYFRHTLMTLGVTDAFFGFSGGTKLAAILGFGKGAEAFGNILSKYGYAGKGINGYGFSGAIEQAALDKEIGWMAGRIASVGAKLTPLTTLGHDVVKGAWHGAGVGYGLGYMHNGHDGGVDGIWGGAGMGGFGGFHGSAVAIRQGYYSHNGATEALRQMGKNDPTGVNARHIEEIIANAEADQDWVRIPMLAGALKQAGNNNITTILHRDADISHINGRNVNLNGVPDADYKVGTKQFRVKELQAEVDRLRKESIDHSKNNRVKEAEASAKLAGEKNAELNKEINEWLTEIRTNGTQGQRERVNSRQNVYKGVWMDGTVGNGTIYINLDETGLVGSSADGIASNATAAHELAHGIQNLILREQAISHFRTTIFGIGTANADLVMQKGALDKELLSEFAGLYTEVLHGNDVVAGDRAKQSILDAYAVIENGNASGAQIEAARDILTKHAEEFGVTYFEGYLRRNKPDYLFRGGKYSAFQRILNKTENWIDFRTKLDLNGQGIAVRIRDVRDARQSQDIINIRNKVNDIVKKMNEINEQASKLTKKDGSVPRENQKEYLKLQEEYLKLKRDKQNLDKSLRKTDIGAILTTADGRHIIIPQAEQAMADLVRRMDSKGDSTGRFSSTLDLTRIKDPAELERVLREAGLEHWLKEDGTLKSQEQIAEEQAERGGKIMDFLEAQPPAVTGIVITTDEKGNKRGVGVLTDEAINALKDAGLLLPSEVIKVTTLRGIIDFVNGRSPLGGGECNITYNALSVEVDGSGRRSKPKHQIEQTNRNIVPYKMEFIMTSKDANGNKIEPRFELMITAIDMGNVLERAADEFPKSYTLPSGKVIKVSDMFSGDFNVFKDHLANYMKNLAEGGVPSADLFGGGEMGEAMRDILHRTLGGIPKGGFDSNGSPLLYNNPIIRPWHPWERGPKFPFTTFRLDLIQDISVTDGKFKFNEQTAYPRHLGNYSPVNFSAQTEFTLNGEKVKGIKGEHEFEVIDKKTGDAKTVKVRYTVISKNGKFYVGGSDFKDKKYSFSTIEQAKDFIGLDSQRRQLIVQNLMPTALVGGDSGILVTNIDGNYMLVDSKNKYRLIDGKVFRNETEAVRTAAKMHNDEALRIIRSQKDPSTRLFEDQVAEITRINDEMPDLLPLRISLNREGKPKLETLKDGEGKDRTYTAKDPAVIAGKAKAGDKIKKLSFQKVSYSLQASMHGSDKNRMQDPAVEASTSHLAELLKQEALEANKDPNKRKGITWYRDMVKSGYSLFGSMYGMFSESLGATSARTPVATNFVQADEALSLFSRGLYNEQLNRIHQAFTELEAKVSQKNPDGSSAFEREAIEFLIRKKSAVEAIEELGLKGDVDWVDLMGWQTDKSAETGITEKLVQKYEELYAENNNGKKNKLTPTQFSEALDTAKKMIFKRPENLMLRENGKKYNANTIKVGQVMYNVWHQLTEGPKTGNFSNNLAGLSTEATIDVWAARTLHRLINSKIKGRSKWRLSAGQEMGVDYVWHNYGTEQIAQWEGGGDFFYGQKAFSKAAELLRAEGGEFKDITPADLQALLWFHEKDIWAKADATNSIGAEMSSYDGPMEALSGGRDPAGIDGWNNVRRIIVGLSGSYDGSLNTKINGQPVAINTTARTYAYDSGKVSQFKKLVTNIFGSSLRGANINQTYGGYGGVTEHSLAVDIISYRGNRTVTALAQQAALLKHNETINKIEALTDKISKETDPKERKKLTTKLKTQQNNLKKRSAELQTKSELARQEQSSPSQGNHLGSVADYIVQQGKNYSQKDVFVAEVVGENHPNARPAGDVRFNKPLTISEALDIAQALIADKAFIGNFTLIPEPRNPNAEKLDKLTKRLNEVTNGGDEWKQIKEEIESLGKFIGVQMSCSPEMSHRYREFSKSPEVKDGSLDLMSVSGAKKFMAGWQAEFSQLSQTITTYNGTGIEYQPYHISAEVIPQGSYDTFNSADIGSNISLGERLDKYRIGLERENALRAENEREGDLFPAESTVFSNNRTVWNPTESQSADGYKLNDALVPDAQGQGKPDSTKQDKVRSAEEAQEWINKNMATPILKSEGGVKWGDKEFTITQKRLPDGTLSNQFEVMGAFDRRPSVVQGKEAAMALIKGRLEGTIGAKEGERILTIGGEEFKVNEATQPVKATDEQAKQSIGIYPTDSNIFKYSPVDTPTVELHPWMSKGIEETFPKADGTVREITPYSHRTQKVLERINALFNSELFQGTGLKMVLRQNSEGTYGSHNDRRTRISFILKQNGRESQVGAQSLTIKLRGRTRGSDGKLNIDRIPNALDEGVIGSAFAFNGSVYGANKGLALLKANYPDAYEYIKRISAETVKQNGGKIIVENNDYRKALIQYFKSRGIEVEQNYNSRYEETKQLTNEGETLRVAIKDLFGSDLAQTFLDSNIASRILSFDQYEKVVYEMQGIGTALNSEMGARLKATGLLGKGTKGISSEVVNQTGAVVKTRETAYGAGNTEYKFQYVGGRFPNGDPADNMREYYTRDGKEAVEINIGNKDLPEEFATGQSKHIDVTTWVDQNQKFSPAERQNLDITRAFPEGGENATEAPYSNRAKSLIGNGYRVIVSGDGQSRFETSLKDKQGEEVARLDLSIETKDGKMKIGKKQGPFPKGGIVHITGYNDGKKVDTHDNAFIGMWAETIERLRQSGVTKIFFDTLDHGTREISDLQIGRKINIAMGGDPSSLEPTIDNVKPNGNLFTALQIAIGKDKADGYKDYHGGSWMDALYSVDPNKRYSPSENYDPKFTDFNKGGEQPFIGRYAEKNRKSIEGLTLSFGDRDEGSFIQFNETKKPQTLKLEKDGETIGEVKFDFRYEPTTSDPAVNKKIGVLKMYINSTDIAPEYRRAGLHDLLYSELFERARQSDVHSFEIKYQQEDDLGWGMRSMNKLTGGSDIDSYLNEGTPLKGTIDNYMELLNDSTMETERFGVQGLGNIESDRRYSPSDFRTINSGTPEANFESISFRKGEVPDPAKHSLWQFLDYHKRLKSSRGFSVKVGGVLVGSRDSYVTFEEALTFLSKKEDIQSSSMAKWILGMLEKQPNIKSLPLILTGANEGSYSKGSGQRTTVEVNPIPRGRNSGSYYQFYNEPRANKLSEILDEYSKAKAEELRLKNNPPVLHGPDWAKYESERTAAEQKVRGIEYYLHGNSIEGVMLEEIMHSVQAKALDTHIKGSSRLKKIFYRGKFTTQTTNGPTIAEFTNTGRQWLEATDTFVKEVETEISKGNEVNQNDLTLAKLFKLHRHITDTTIVSKDPNLPDTYKQWDPNAGSFGEYVDKKVPDKTQSVTKEIQRSFNANDATVHLGTGRVIKGLEKPFSNKSVYRYQNLMEFLISPFNDPTFMKSLSELGPVDMSSLEKGTKEYRNFDKMPNFKNLFEQFIDVVAEFIGFKKTDKNAATQLIELVQELQGWNQKETGGNGFDIPPTGREDINPTNMRRRQP